MRNTSQKCCSHCNETKPIEMFRLRKVSEPSRGRVSWCKSCVNKQRREYRADRRSKVLEVPPFLGAHKCSLCKTWLPGTSDFFGKQKRHLSGLSSWCHACKRLRARESYRVHREKVLAAQRKYTELNREDINSRRRSKYADPGEYRDEVLKRNKAYRDKHKDKASAYYKTWRKTTGGRQAIKAAMHTHKHRLRGAGKINKAIVLRVIAACSDDTGTLFCSYCHSTLQANAWHLEHRLPLSRGGTNEYTNLTVSCPKCNLEKGTKTPEEYAVWKEKHYGTNRN